MRVYKVLLVAFIAAFCLIAVDLLVAEGEGPSITRLTDTVSRVEGKYRMPSRERSERGKALNLMRDTVALHLAALWVESEHADSPEPEPFFVQGEAIDVCTVWNWFPDDDNTHGYQAKLDVKIIGNLTSGAKRKDHFEDFVTWNDASEIYPGCLSWRLYDLPPGRYELRIKVKSCKPCKGRGKTKTYFEVIEDS